MEDSSQVLEHGTGTPYVAIFNNLKEVILPSTIVKVNYSFYTLR